MTTFVSGPASNGRFNDLNLAVWLRPPAATPTPTGFTIAPNADLRIEYAGSDFTFDANGNVTGGTVTSISVFSAGVSVVELSGLQLPVATLRTFTQDDDTPAFLSAILSGDDNISVAGLAGLEGPNLLNGFGGNDAIRGAGGDDTLRGGAGNDTLTAGVGIDSLIGGAGNDVYVVSTADDILDETDGSGTDTVIVEGTEFSLFTNGRGSIENIAIATFGLSVVSGNDLNNKITGNGSQNSVFGFGGSDTIDGGGSADTLDGGSGADKLIGGDGDDSLVGGGGNDTLLGGAGDDSYIIDDGDSIVEAQAGLLGGNDSVRYTGLRDSVTLGANIETLILGSGFNGSGNELDNRMAGNTAANKLFGLAGDDTLDGNGNNDTLDGGKGADFMSGGDGADTYIVDHIFDLVDENGAGPGKDTVRSSISFRLDGNLQAAGDVENLVLTGTASNDGSGNALDNAITGNGGKNRLSGLDGDDTLDGGAGADTLVGGAGNDTYVINSAADLIEESGADMLDMVVAGMSVDLNAAAYRNIESVLLTGSAALNAFGTDVGNQLLGNAGANRLSGFGSLDELRGGAGNDTLDGGAGDDFMFGGAGNDVYIVDSPDDVVLGEIAGSGGGIDTVSSSAKKYTMSGNVENLILEFTAANGTGNDLSNLIAGNATDNQLEGKAGNDTLAGGDGNDTLIGDDAGKDVLIGGIGSDRFLAGNGDKIMEALPGEGGGDDVVVYSGTGSFTLGKNLESLELAAGSAAVVGIGNGINNIITGNSNNNRLLGMGGDDILTAVDGSNTLDGGAGADTMIGAFDFDLFVVDNPLDVIDESLGGIIQDAVHSSISFDLTENGTTIIGRLEDLVLTGSKAINGTGNFLRNTITGNAAANVIDGGDATDILFGGGGNDSLIGGADANGDILDGGAGADTMDGGEGNDFYTVDNVKDFVAEHDGLAGGLDFVFASVSYALGGEIENLILTGKAANGTGNFQDNRIDGNLADNILRGLEGNDILVSVGGNDTLDGGIGNDTMFGGTGNDTYLVDAFDDAVDEASGGGIDTVIASTTYTLSNLAAADIENLTLAANAGNIDGRGNDRDNRIAGNDGKNTLAGFGGNDTISGGAHDDELRGGDGNDSLSGGNDIDRLFGEAGDDTLNGGSGRDFYFYQSMLDGHDLIVGFDGNPAGDQDFLDLDALFDSLVVATADRAARVQLTDRGSAVDLRIDTNNDGVFDLFAATLQTADAVTVGSDVVVGAF